MAIQAAAAILAADEFFDSLKAGIDEFRSSLMNAVALFRPVEIELFERSLKDLYAAFGQMLTPAIESATGLLHDLADYVYSLPAEFKEIVSVVAELGAHVGIFASIAAGVTGLAVAFVGLSSLIGGPIGAAVVALGYAFTQTSGGAKFLEQALRFVEEEFAMVQQTAIAVWDALAPLRAGLSDALSELGDSLGGLLNELKPLVAGGIVAVGSLLKEVIGGMISWLTNLVRAISQVASAIQTWVGDLNRSLGLEKLKPPDVSRDKKDSMGLGWGGGSVTSPDAFYKQIQEEIFRNARPPDETQNPIESKVGQIKDLLEQIRDAIKNTKTAAVQGVNTAAASAMTIAPPPVRGLYEIGRIILGR